MIEAMGSMDAAAASRDKGAAAVAARVAAEAHSAKVVVEETAASEAANARTDVARGATTAAR